MTYTLPESSIYYMVILLEWEFPVSELSLNDLSEEGQTDSIEKLELN